MSQTSGRGSSNGNKRKLSKQSKGKVHENEHYAVFAGKLKRGRGNPGKTRSLFKYIAEKIPCEFLNDVKKDVFNDCKLDGGGVYICHDSMGYPRYIGRGAIFTRLASHLREHPTQLKYFSLFIVEDKIHEREIETIMLRAAGPLLDFNDRKIRVGTEPGDVKDFEPGTIYAERRDKTNA